MRHPEAIEQPGQRIIFGQTSADVGGFALFSNIDAKAQKAADESKKQLSDERIYKDAIAKLSKKEAKVELIKVDTHSPNIDFKDEKTTLTVGYIAPGWPLSDCPNGIVAYIEYIISGIDKEVRAVVFARFHKGPNVTDDVINLSEFSIAKKPLQDFIDKILFRIKLPYAKSLLYQRNANFLAKNNNLAFLSTSTPLDIIEMEECFGFSHFLIKLFHRFFFLEFFFFLYFFCFTTEL